MKVLWLCNNAPGAVRSHISGKPESGVNWMDHVLTGLRSRGLTVRILYRGTGGEGVMEDGCSYASFGEAPPHIYHPELEARFRQELRTFQPDVIHSWGVEYDHALAMVSAAEKEGLLHHMAASIQGLCGHIALHYADGIPMADRKKSTFRDLVRRDNILQQQEKFRLRGVWEASALRKLRHVIGRTSWDQARTAEVQPEGTYHFCNETLREPFYQGQWQYDACRKHRIFASSCSYPVKGFHYLLEAAAKVREVYPDVTLTVTGRSFLAEGVRDRLRRNGYEQYLWKQAKQYHLEDAITFLGDLSAEEMKAAYLDANVFCLPSTIENSPNSLGEAMILGVPCVAARVGGVADLMQAGEEGLIYEPGDVDALAQGILRVFAVEEGASQLGRKARAHALQTHDPETNLQRLLQIYEMLQ